MTAETTRSSRRHLALCLWVAGMIGVGSILPVLPSLLAKQGGAQLDIPMRAVQAATLAQTGVLLAVAVFLGVVLAPRVGLAAPAAEAAVTRRSILHALKPQILPGIQGGVLGGVLVAALSSILLPHLPTDFVAASRALAIPLLPRLLYGGISEEILMRWGVMTLLVWIPYRTLQKRQGRVRTRYFAAAIVISSVLFGLGHLPAASALSASLSALTVAYVIIANTLFGLIAGYLYWRRGLESAMIAHMVFHVILVNVERLVL